MELDPEHHQEPQPNSDAHKGNAPEGARSDVPVGHNTAETVGSERPTVVIRKRTVVWRIGNIGVTIGLVLLALIFAALIFTQLPIFRTLIVHELVKTVEESTNGTLVIKEVKGNILTGFVMNDVSLVLKTNTKYDTVPILHVDHVLAQYSLIRYLRRNQIGVVDLVLQHPVVRLVKFQGDTVWNTHLLFKPVASAKKAAPKPFTQIVDLQSLRIQNGAILMRDFNAAPRPIETVAGAEVKEREIDWKDVDVEGLDLDSRLYAKGGTAQSLTVSHLRFTEKQSGFFVQHLEFSGYLDSIQARMDNASITTGHTSIGFSLEVVPPSIIKTGLLTSMEHSSVHLKLNGPTISTYELKQFLPVSLGFLAGSPGIDLETTGEFGHLHIDHLGLDFKGKGGITVAGDLTNLQHTRDLFMDLTLVAHDLTNNTLNSYVPGLHIPNLSNYGVINIPTLHYVGEPLNFKTALDLRTTGAGNVNGTAALDLRNHGFRYTADLKTARLNLGAVLKKPQFASDINSELKLHGVGTNWRTLVTDVQIHSTAPSSFSQYRFGSLDLTATMEKGIAHIHRLDGSVEGGPDVHVKSAEVDLVRAGMPFQFDGTVINLPIAKLVKSAAGNPARLDVTANVRGSASNIEDLTGTIHGTLHDLVFQGHRFKDVNLTAQLAPSRSGENKLEVQSDIADVSIDHRFRLKDLTTTVPEHIKAVLTAIKDREFPTDSSARTPVIARCADSIDFDYYIRLKDLRPLAGFIPSTFLLSQGAVSGSVFGCPQGDISVILEADSLGLILRDRKVVSDSLPQPVTVLMRDDSLIRAIDTLLAHVDTSASRTPFVDSLKVQLAHLRTDSIRIADSARVSPLALPKFGQGTPRIHLTPTTFRLVANNISNNPKTVFEHLDATLNFENDSVIRLGSALLEHPHIALAYKNRTLDFDIATIYNDVLGVRLNGDATFPANEFDITLDTLVGVYYNHAPGAQLSQYRWFNERPSHIRFRRDGLIAIDTLNLVHPLGGLNPGGDFVQRLSLGGQIKGDSLDVWAHVPQFDLKDIPKLLPLNPKSKTMRLTQFEGTVKQLDLKVDGTLERPNIATHLAVDSLIYSDMHFDSAYADLTYKDENLRGVVMLHVDTVNFRTGESQLPFDIQLSSQNEFRAVIDSIPMLITFKHGPNYAADSAAVLTRPLSASINASHFPIDIATPFIPVFTTLTGAGDIHFAITGTQEHIVYGGYATVHDGSFLLSANNLYYFFDGTVAFKDNSLTLSDITLRNVPADDPYGLGTVKGHFDFQGFAIKYFDLALHTDRLRVLSNDSKSVVKSIYGPLTINTGGQDFHFMNTFKEPWLRGKIGIMSASLNLPQSDNYTQTVSSEGIVYRVLPNDSLIQSHAVDSLKISHEQMMDFLKSSASVSMSTVDDSLFPNKMKDLYLDENGNPRDSSQTAYTAPGTSLAPSFVDRLRMDMQITTDGDVWVNMPFSGIFGVLGVKLSAELQGAGPIYVKRGDDLQTSVIGDLNLTSNSSFRFYQTFTISSGRVSFQGNFNNPILDVTADYVGPYSGNDAGVSQVKLELQITGTKKQPDLVMRIYEDKGSGFELTEVDAAAQQDVIYYLISGGSFKRDLDEQGEVNVLSRAAKSLSSDVLNTMFAGLFGSSSSAFSIRSAALRFGGAGLGLQLTAAYRSVTLSYNGGAVNDPLKADYIFNFPFSAIFPNLALGKQVNVELDLHTNSQSSSIAGSPADQPLFLGKVLYHIKL